MSSYERTVHETRTTSTTVAPGDLIPVDPHQNTNETIQKIKVTQVIEQPDGTRKVVTETQLDDGSLDENNLQGTIEDLLQQEKMDRKASGDPIPP
jgi:hypothetical protein